MNEKGQINIKIIITGTVFVAIAIFGAICLGIGKAFDEVIPGSGSSLTDYGTLAFVILIILAVVIVAWFIMSPQ
jgi:hypothetical protein